MGLAKVISVALVLVCFELGFTTGCYHFLVLKSNSFTSPNYPNNYPDNVNCSWLIQTDAPIILTFTDFNLDSCCDFITIYDGSTTESPILFDDSSDSNSIIASTSKNVLVTFTSDESGSTSGFKLSYSSSDCNQVISSDSGVIGSPRDRNFSTCRWYFNTEKPIVFTFPWFNVEADDFFSLTVYDGIKQTSKRLFETSSRRNRPSVIRTTTNQALFIYISENPLSGFTANYSINRCHEVLSSGRGNIISPNHPLNYPDGANCRWLIKGDNPISLSFSRFDLADNNDRITIYEGATESSEILYQSFSSNVAVPSSVVSIAHEMLITFSSDGSGSSSGFYATYEPFRCVYVLDSDSGWFSSPKYPKNYPDNLKCSWLIKATKPIVISFLAFDLEKNKDWLTIYDGSSTYNSLLLKTSSNETIPSLIQTSYGQAFITFTSDESGSSSGFNATFEPYRCRHVFSSVSGWFSSPNHPKKYPDNFNCSWLINSTQPISLSFTQFKIQSYDRIEIYDGPTNSSRLLWNASHKIPSLILSTTHQLLVIFTSDNYGSDSGFNATYSPSRCQYISSPDSGWITSPNYPKNYPDNSNNCWIINATQPIQLSFNSFRLQANKDWLTVYDGQTTAYQLLNASSKEIPSSIITSSNQMLIIFTSDASKSLSGFNATYQPYRCQYELSASESGWFASPNHPKNYPGNANCSWLISGTNRISLSFIHFQLRGNDDWIKLYDGPTTESTLIFKKTVGSSIPSPVVSTTNQVLVVFVSDREYSSSGFNATYSQCQTSENGWFTSPNYPDEYPNNANNCWLINAKVPLYIRFPGRFRLEQDKDWLTVYNGPTQSSKQLLHWSFSWGSGILHETVTSTSNQLLVTFTSNGDRSNTGFNLTYSPDGCTYVNADVQPKWFTSKNYPDNYHSFSKDCWLMNSTHPMILSFSRFELEADSDWLSVYDGPLITNNQLLRASTNYTIPSSIVSTANQVLVTFTSDTFDNFIGFNATYSNYYPGITERPVECNETIHVNSTGFVLTSLNYPSSYPNIRCQWHFTSDPDTRIKISFTDFSTQPEDYVSIFPWKMNRNPNNALLFASGLNNTLPSLSCNHLSVTNLLHVFFNPLSDPSTNQLMPSKAGFRALLSVTSVQECGGSFNKSEDVLLGYQKNTRHLMFSGCVWYIRAETDSHVKLTLSIDSGSNKTSAFSYSLKVYEVNLLETDGIFPLNEYDFKSDSEPFSVSSTNNDITVMLNDTTKYDKCRPRDYPQLNLSYQIITNSD